MRIRQHRFDTDVEIVNLGDVHRGDKTCDVSSFLKTIEYIRKYDNVYWVSTGDLLNVALKTSLSDVYTSLSLDNELDAIKKETECIAAKCLGLVSSNHHNRLTKSTGLNLDKRVASELNIPYLGKIGLLVVSCGNNSYYIAMHHGVGGGKRRGSKINNIEDFATMLPGADIYMEGHTHAYAAFVNQTQYIDRKRVGLRKYNTYFVTTGHYLEWEDSYAQDYKMKPMPIGSSIVSLSAKGSGHAGGKKVAVDLLTH